MIKMLQNITSPLEQFEIHIYYPLSFSGLDFSITNLTIGLCLFLLLLLLWYFYIYEWDFLIPKLYQLIFEKIHYFVSLLIIDNIGKKALLYYPFIFLIFVIIFFFNLLGMLPYLFTLTSHIVLTFFLSFTCFFGLNILGIIKNGLNFFSLFLPNGTPLVLAPFLILIELISYIARVFSLSIRLFANIMSGHTLLKILAGFGWNMFFLGGLNLFLAFIPFLIVFVVTGLELAIAGLQAYVFVVLVCIYLNDALYLH